MAFPPVHWFEGMFLRPHHLQADDRHWMQYCQTNAKWDVHHNWGLRSMDLDLDALSNFRLVIRSLKARLPDGTVVMVPEEGTLPEVDLKAAFMNNTSLTIFLGVPRFNLGKSNTSQEPGSEVARYLVAVNELEDENTGVNSQPIEVRRLNVKLLLSTQDHLGHTVLAIARIEKSFKAASTVEVVETYVPPLLSGDAWVSLQRMLQGLYDRIGKKIEVLTTQAVTRSVSFETKSEGDAQMLAQLSALNKAFALLGVLAFSPGVHPFQSYLELCCLVGELSIFGKSRRAPLLPRYDHDDLGGCFYAVKRHLDAILDALVEPEYKERPFVGVGIRMQVSLEPAWVEPSWTTLIGVRTPLEADECINLLTRPGQLDLKLASSDRVETIFRMGQAGIKLTACPRPPLSLPVASDLIYFQIDPASQREEWQAVQRSLTLALRVNETLISGDIQGQRVISIKRPGGVTIPMQFMLYAAPVGRT